MRHEPEMRTHQPRRLPGAGWFVGPVFLLLAGGLLLSRGKPELPVLAAVEIDPAALGTQPRRVALSDPPTINIDGFDRTCMSCHRMFPPREVEPGRLLQHRQVVLDHGINNRCHNCHDGADRNLLVLRDGTTIGYERVVELCAQCHGPTFRDWQRGAHGRTNGYWDKSRGPQQRLGCTECHNPHEPRVPAMDSMAPLPGPHALRAAREDVHAVHAGGRDPLRRHAARGHVEPLPPPAGVAPVEYFEESEE